MNHTRTTTTPAEAAWIVILCFGWFILASSQSVAAGFQSGDFSDSAMLPTLAMEVLCASIALLVLYRRGYAVTSLYPAPTPAGIALGIGLYGVSLYASWLAVMPFVSGSPQPIDELMARASISLPTIVLFALINGAYEEIFLLGFLLRGLRGHGLSMALGISLLVRVLYHLYQGPLGAVSVLAFGLVLSLYYIRSGALFPAVFAHVLADIVPFM
ncbi:CPBP family intramembrane glutamic endopeptidase [Azovibrio restrictus]|uniref:CPBP family intramembrane glutamic endopeptidase n=1 Tax=Azovibrio restrictus TaxID=146938 RepID=UPI000429DCBA|nr:CPBP family intramembrane glutamic endopeptidase [Azovibrio restrictus]